ncbi:MAG: PASTA domain-containing protein [Ilumatobacteraceae bacterium]
MPGVAAYGAPASGARTVAAYQQSYEVVEPVVPVVPLDPPVERLYAPPPESHWPYVLMAAIFALLVGGIGGYLIGNRVRDDESPRATNTTAVDGAVDEAALDQRVNDVFTTLLGQAQQDGEVKLPTGYPQLDALLAISRSTADGAAADASGQQAQIDSLTIERAQLGDQVAMLEQQATVLQERLTAAEAARDELRTMLEANGGTTTDLQAQLDAQLAEITRLQDQVNTLTAAVADAKTELTRVQGELDDANAELQRLDVRQVADLVGVDIATVRSTAKANGWSLVEQLVDKPTAPPDTVTAQLPTSGSNMIAGSVLYVEIAQKPQP